MLAKFFLVKEFKKHKHVYVSKNTGTIYYILQTPRKKLYRFQWHDWNLYKKNKKLGVFTTLMEAILHANKDQE